MSICCFRRASEGYREREVAFEAEPKQRFGCCSKREREEFAHQEAMPVYKAPIKKIGDYQGNEVVQLSNGREYVYINALEECIALRKYNFLSLRSIQSIAATLFSLISGASVGYAVFTFAAVSLSMAAGIGVAVTLLVGAIALSIIWTCNTMDIDVQLATRERCLKNNEITSDHFTTPAEKLSFFRNKQYSSYKEFLIDISTLHKLGLINNFEDIVSRVNGFVESDKQDWEDLRTAVSQKNIEQVQCIVARQVERIDIRTLKYNVQLNYSASSYSHLPTEDQQILNSYRSTVFFD